MKAVCPNNSNHKTFYTVAHVAQDWKVDEYGNFLDCMETMETVAKPSADNTWQCADCGAEAEVSYT